MKSERRHELQTNYLADHLGSAVATSKPYAKYVASAIAILIVAAIGYGLYATQTAKANAAAWGAYYFNIGSGDAEVFQQVAQDHSGTAAANWAKQAWADSQLLQGLDQLYTNRQSAEETITGAIDRAAMGLAQAYEAIGKLEDATRYYKQVASSNQSAYAAMANNRLAWIASGDGKAFYEWFASVRSTPTPPPAIPGNLSQPPSTPDISFPPLPGAQAGPVELKTDGSAPATPPPPVPESTTSPAEPAAEENSLRPQPSDAPPK
jgi:hypothetical protein